jgi:allantoicase
MRNIAELNMLLRGQIELPTGLKLATEEFREGWSFVRSVDACHLEKKIQTRGWNFIKIADAPLRSGVGDTAQLAIASALQLTLRHVSTHFNAAEVEHIELTQYPWFFLARIRVYPYRIQKSAALTVPDEFVPRPIAKRHKLLSPNSAALYPYFGSAMPLLRQMLVSTQGSQSRPQ